MRTFIETEWLPSHAILSHKSWYYRNMLVPQMYMGIFQIEFQVTNLRAGRHVRSITKRGLPALQPILLHYPFPVLFQGDSLHKGRRTKYAKENERRGWRLDLVALYFTWQIFCKRFAARGRWLQNSLPPPGSGRTPYF